MSPKKKVKNGMDTQKHASPRPVQQLASGSCVIPTESSDLVDQESAASVTGRVYKASDAKQKQSTRTAQEPPTTTETLDLDLHKKLAKRPDYGTQGEKIDLLVNYYPVELPSGNIYHYDVEISPVSRGSPTATGYLESPKQPERIRPLSKKKKRKIISTMLDTSVHFRYNRPAFDGQKNLYTSRPLQNTPLTVLVELSDDSSFTGCSGAKSSRKDEFEVSIQPVRKKDSSDCAISLRPLRDFLKGGFNEVPNEIFMAVETILLSGPSFRYVPLGRAFFYPPVTQKDLHPLGGGKEIWFGYRQNFLFAERKPVLNVNVTTTTFHRSGPVINYMSEILGYRVSDLFIRELRDFEIAKLTKKLKGLEVKSVHNGFRKRVVKVTREAANRLFFLQGTDNGAVRKRVSDYFLEKYQRQLQYPHLPCLQVLPESKNVYLPVELCEIVPGQHADVKSLTEDQSRKMIQASTLRPSDRFYENQRALRRANFDNDPCCQDFGIRISPEPLRVGGRIIDSPTVQYRNEQSVTPINGCWDMMKLQFYKAADVNCWLLMSFVDKDKCNWNKLQNFLRMLLRIARRCGIHLPSPESVEQYNEIDMKRAGVTLRNAVRKNERLKLVVIILPGRNVEHHKEVKRVAEKELGVMTQCVAVTTLDKCRDDALTKLCQKINAKMGGINNALFIKEVPEILKKPLIIIGADVNHPDVNKPHQPSIAAVVGSLDRHPFRYAVTWRLQRHKNENKKALEVIKDLKDMVVELLKAFFIHTKGKKPEKILFYRDGVSYGQFLQVREEEITAVKEACRSLQTDYDPGLTFIIVQKRHHTRFFIDSGDGTPSNVNASPGTVVDRTATSKIYFDFFMYSHFGRQGTSRPGHYTVLFDENGFTSDDLQKLTYYLCHIYARCTSSISIPVPVMYADQAAYRVREYLNAQSGGSSSSSEASGGDFQGSEASLLETSSVHHNLKSAMYFV